MVRHCPYNSCQRLYDDYYTQQVGHGLPVFVGGRSHRGYGLGSILAGIGRSVVPLLKKGGKALLKEGARTGLRVAHDVLSGESVGSSLKRQASQGGKRLFNQAFNHVTGSSKQKRIKRAAPVRKKQTTRQRGKKQQSKRDIFG